MSRLPFRLLGLAVLVSIGLLLLCLTSHLQARGGHETSQAVPPRPRLHFLFPVTAMNALACKSLLSALVHGYEPVLLNWGAHETGGKARQIKVQGVQDYLARNVTDPTDLVLMVDAFDVWFQQPPEVLIDRFMADPSRVLLGADKRCWPPPANPAECSDLPSSPLPAAIYGKATDTGAELAHEHTFYLNRRRWPNSGTILGPAGLLRPVYADLTALAASRDANLGDQQLFMSLYHARPNAPLTLDMTSSLFQTLTYSADDLAFLPAPHHLAPSSISSPSTPPASGADAGLPARPPLAHNTASGTLPVVLHFNGAEKRLLDRWWASRLWYVTGGPGAAAERQRVRRWVRERVRGRGARGAGAEGAEGEGGGGGGGGGGGATVAETGAFLSWRELGCEALLAEAADGFWPEEADDDEAEGEEEDVVEADDDDDDGADD